MKRIAFFGGSFDPVHNAHLRIAQKLPDLFGLDEFYFVPAFHAPHKPDQEPLSAYHRFAMLTAATENEPKVKISTIELDESKPRYTIETAAKLLNETGSDAQIFFVIGADSWRDITTWREWEKLLLMVNFIVVERPGVEIVFSHVTPEIAACCTDLRGKSEAEIVRQMTEITGEKIYFTDTVKLDISATEIRRKIEKNAAGWQADLPAAVAKYIEKYQIYK
ncbi:MAG TPA: nicotinate-nucleotide adenylyltransferase [Pyrinomonadaceae bacterium]|jgi:nicotinate-nucleotide adenylyltransferase|nr:nicotinate-nucleotide adenylyltransferase [Pyrinomonadaceae bacterium]